MRVISRRNLLADSTKHPDVASQIDAWYRVVKTASWKSLVDVRKVYPSADEVSNFTIFNIKGNKYRLIVSIDYEAQIVYFKYFLTHAEYDKGDWKNDPYF